MNSLFRSSFVVVVLLANFMKLTRLSQSWGESGHLQLLTMLLDLRRWYLNAAYVVVMYSLIPVVLEKD